MVIEKQEYKKYVQFIDKSQILILPNKYLKEYNTCDNYGMSKSVGPGAARNFVGIIRLKMEINGIGFWMIIYTSL